MTTKELKDKFEKVCSQGQQIQKTLKYHQNKLKSLFSNPKTDSTVLEAALDKLATVYSELDACINQDYPQLKFNFFPSNMDVSYSVKYAGGTFPDDLTLCHNKKSKLKEIRSSLKRKIISKELSKVSCVEERDCVIAVDMKRMVVRGVVIGVTHQIVKLLDIDTGDYKNAVVDNIYELDEEAVSLYALCVRCGLDGDLADLKEFWTADLSHYFISALNYGELVIETSHYVDESTSIPPRFKVTIEVFVDDTKVLNVNHWVCDQLLPLVKREAQNCLDLQKVIQGLDPKVLMPYLQVGSGVSLDSSSNLSDSVVCSSQIISSPESSARSSSSESSEEYSVDIQIDKFDTPSFLPSTSAVINGPALSSGKKEIDVYFTNENMVASPSSESLVAERSKSKCDCGTNCAPIVGCCPPELLQSNPKVPRITTVIPSLASIPHGEPFYYKMKNKSKSSLLPTPSTTHTNTSGDTNKSETELRSMESAFYNKSNGRLPPDGIKHRSDNSLSSTSPSHLGSSSRRGPRSHLYTLPLPSYMTEADGYGAGLNASAGDAFVGGVGYPEEKLVPLSGSGGSGPNSRGEGLSLKQQHFCLAGHLDKVQCVKLPRSVLLVEPGQERKALISFTETPSKFFVNIVDENNAHLEQLEEELCSHYSQVNNLVSLVTIEEARYHLGEYVAAKWKSDNRWYRARVIDWNVCTKNSIAILYVDHGNVDLVPLDYIQPLDPHFTQYAIMALPCHLAHVSPASSSGWSQDAIDMFSQFCDKPLELFYLTFQPSGSNDSFCSWSVVLRNAKGECINELLVSAGHAIHTGKINGHTTPAPVPPAPAQPPTPTPLTPAPTPDRGHLILSRIQGLVKQMQIKNANINSALETKSNANSVHEGNSDSSRYATPEPADGIDYNNVEEAMNQLVPDTFDKFDNSSDLIDLNNVYEDNMECRNNSHDIDLNTHKQIKFYDKPNNINKNESLIESNNRLKSDMSNSDLQIVSRGKPSNIDNIKNKESESHDLTNRDKESLNNHSGIVSVSKSYVSASLSVRRYLSNQNNCSTNTSASTVGLLSYEATASPEPELGDGPIPELEEDRVHRIITQASHDQSSPENHGRLSRNSNISCVSSEALAMVEQMLNKCNENIEQTNQKLSETLADIEVKELNVPRTNLTHGTKPLIEVKELNVPRTESSQVLNNNQMSQDKNNLMMKSYNNGERIVNRLKSPIPHVQALKNTNYKTNSDSNPSTSNQYKINSEHRPSSTNQISPNIPNTKQYISHIEYDPSKCTTNHFNSTSYPTNDNSPTYETNEKEDKTLSGIDENLNENLLVSSSESSARRGKLPPIMKKPPQRKPVKENLNTILTKMPVNEMEKQKMIEQFVHNSLQQAKQSGNLVNDDNNAYDTIRHRNNVRQEFCRTEQTSVHSESRRDNKGQGSNEQSQEYFEDEKSSEKRLNDLGGNKNVLYDSNLSQDLLPDYIDVNQLEPKDQARLNNQLETKVQDRMPNDQDKMIKYQKRLLMDDQDRLIENENGISPYNNNNNHMESKEEDIMPEDQDRAAKDHNRMPLSEELAVKKKTSYRGRPRKYSKYADDPAGPSLKSLAQKRNIFECLKQTSNSNSADVSSEETSSDVPSKVRSSKTKPHKTEQQPNTLQNNTAHKSNPGTLSTTSNTAHKLNSSGITNSKDNAAPRSSPSPSRVSNASSQSFITHKPGHKSEEAASRSKTQKWFWLTLQQETLLKSKAGKTIKVRVMRIPAVGEFYCQPVGVFPEYELGFKTLFFNSNTPQVYSQFKPMTSIRPGKLVMVCDPNSNKWYRSEVQDKVEGQDLFKVFFVDFGTEAFVPGNSIREIQPDYTQIPYQAIHCQLQNISVCPNPEFVESEDYIKYLKVWSDMLRVGQTHEVKIMEVDSNLVRVTLEDSGGFDMGELLALSCSTPFVELKSNRLQGAWTDYVFDYCE